MHWLATGLALLFVAVLALDQRYGLFRHSPGGEAFEVNEQPVFLALFAIGVLVAVRWQIVGGAIASFTAAALVVFAGEQLRTLDALLVLFGFLVPALIWVTVGLFDLRDEQFHRSPDEPVRSLLRRRDVLFGGVALAGTLVAGLRVGRWIFDRVYGPTHPSSSVRGISGSTTRWSWSGAITGRSAAVTTRLVDDDREQVQLLVSTDPSLEGARTIEGESEDEGLLRIDVDDLEPATEYFYAFVVRGEVDRARIGRFRTFAEPGDGEPSSIGIVFGGCARTGSNAAVFDTIRSLEPDLMVFNGDLHYADITRNDEQAFRQVLDYTLSRPAQEALFGEIPVAYVWDDHDFGGETRASGSRPAAMATYRRYVPHYPLASPTSAVYQAFSIGAVRIVLTDARSERVPGDDDLDNSDLSSSGLDNSGLDNSALSNADLTEDARDPGTMLGREQVDWLLDELLSARDTHRLTIWVNPVPWISAEVELGDGDDWGAFPDERREIADFIAEHDLARSLLMVVGDAHMVAIDDGSNSDYSQAGGAGFPVFQAAALDRPGSVKGGPYSHGTFPGGGQFGYVTIDDDGGSMRVRLSGRNWRNDVLVDYEFTVPP